MAKIKGFKVRTVFYTQEYTMELTPELIEFFNQDFDVNYSEEEIIELINREAYLTVTADENDMLDWLTEQLYEIEGKCSKEELDHETAEYYEIGLEN